MQSSASHDIERRNKIVRESHRCTNCLHESHTQSKCPSSFSCRHCHGRHHSLLHKDQPSSSTQTITVNSSFIKAQKGVNENKTAPLSPPKFYFIDTAIVNVVSGDRHQLARAALDSGSGVSLMSESLASHLKLPRYSQHIIVEGAYSGGNSKHFVQAMQWTATLPIITNFSIPRRMTLNDHPVIFRALHGFSDASSMAYGAAVYLRIMHENMTTSVSLITSKARVLPVKAITIPRAELTAKLLHISQAQIFAWTDSTIVLCWLQKPSSSLKTFVANRVSSIQELLPSSKWRHVPTNQNPADLLSRGMHANQLVWNSLLPRCHHIGLQIHSHNHPLFPKSKSLAPPFKLSSPPNNFGKTSPHSTV